MCLLIVFGTACSRLPPPQESGELIVGIRATPAFFELNGVVPEGFEHDLVEEFAKGLGAKARFVMASSPQHLESLLADGKIHLAASMPLLPGAPKKSNRRWVGIRSVPQWIVSSEDSHEYGWQFSGPHADALQQQAQLFIDRARKDGTLARLDDRYFGHIERVNADGVAKYIDAIATRLPAYAKLFQAAQALTGIDWRLLAALAYHESKWDPLATSPTNVRGIMMLTEATADHLGVANRLDAKESILAGARYLAQLLDQLPPSTKHPDRLWLALSAYNLGMGHFNGARAFARGMKRDPDSWYDMKKVLPTLSRPEVYARLKSGKARGGEAVIMVENIRVYYDILSRIDKSQAGTLGRPRIRANHSGQGLQPALIFSIPPM